jgi:2-polyprenyl-3-methyl-5-hydroxy-6-metoxy-1,4-benzoquinol methylase
MPNCLACGHADSQHWADASDEEYCTTSDTFAYRRCNRCGVLFIDPVPRDRLNEIYPSNYYSFDEQVTDSLIFRIKDRLDQRFFKRFMAKFAQQEIDILDVGGGAGLQLSSLRKADSRVSRTAIVDLNEQAGDKARELGHEYFCGRFEDYTATKPFDMILMLNLIEHVDNPKALLHKAGTLLSTGGIVIIKTPNTDSLDARIFRHKNWGGYHCPRHWVLFDRENFVALANEAGLRIRHFSYTQGAPFWTTSVLFALARRKWISISRERPAPQHPLYPLLNIVFAAFDMLRSPFAKTSQMIAVLERA